MQNRKIVTQQSARSIKTNSAKISRTGKIFLSGNKDPDKMTKNEFDAWSNRRS